MAEADTTPGPKPIPLRQIVKLSLLGLVAVAAVLGVLSFFVDLRGLWSQAVEKITPVKVDEIEVDISDFKDQLTVEKTRYDSRAGALVLTLKRTEAFPKDDEALRALLFVAQEDDPGSEIVASRQNLQLDTATKIEDAKKTVQQTWHRYCEDVGIPTRPIQPSHAPRL